MTPNMRNFIDKNAINKIIAGGHITANGTPIKNPSESVGVEYHFEDGSTLIVSKLDAQSAPEFSPTWKLE